MRVSNNISKPKVITASAGQMASKSMRANSTGLRMMNGTKTSFVPASNFSSRNGSMQRSSVVMQATLETETAPAAVPKKEYNPEMFDNKYVKKSDVSKNPIYNISSIAVEAKNGKVPKIESF